MVGLGAVWQGADLDSPVPSPEVKMASFPSGNQQWCFPVWFLLAGVSSQWKVTPVWGLFSAVSCNNFSFLVLSVGVTDFEAWSNSSVWWQLHILQAFAQGSIAFHSPGAPVLVLSTTSQPKLGWAFWVHSGHSSQPLQLLGVLAGGVAARAWCWIQIPLPRRMGKCEMQGLLFPSGIYSPKGRVLIRTSLVSFMYLSALGFMILVFH